MTWIFNLLALFVFIVSTLLAYSLSQSPSDQFAAGTFAAFAGAALVLLGLGVADWWRCRKWAKAVK